MESRKSFETRGHEGLVGERREQGETRRGGRCTTQSHATVLKNLMYYNSLFRNCASVSKNKNPYIFKPSRGRRAGAREGASNGLEIFGFFEFFENVAQFSERKL